MALAAAEVETVSPRIRLASRLYASGAVPTKRAAAIAAGIHPGWFNKMSNHNEETKRLIGSVDEMLQDQTVQMSAVLRIIGRKAIQKINNLMEQSQDEKVVFKAAVDLADRNPETSKVQRHEVLTAVVDGEAAKDLARALVESAKVHQLYGERMRSDYVQVDLEVQDGSQGHRTLPVGAKEATDAGKQGQHQAASQQDQVPEDEVSAA